MKRDVQLYIAGRRVDLGDDSWILFNWTREDLSNPTAVLNSSSHQITIPGTCRNNAVFGEAFRLDRRTLFGIRYDGTYFDPTRKTPFTLYQADGTVLESGYCRLDAIDTHSLRHAYTVSLFGGLGSFFYALASKDDGSARTLADLVWKGDDGNDVASFNISVSDLAGGGAAAVADAWGHLRTGTSALGFYHFWNVVNFAPAYNGLPADFDASHAVSNEEAYINVPAGMDEDGERPYDFNYKDGFDVALLTFANSHTEWETGDLRWYLQRPVVSVRAFIAAVCDTRNNGGYTVTLDPTFFKNDNPAYANAWWTLPLVSTENRNNVSALGEVLKSTKTPMRYLCDYCKHFGLVFLWDGARKTVSIVTRATFYGENAAVMDFTGRVDRSQQISQDPVLADKRWYQLGNGGKGEFAEQFKDSYGKAYACQRIDTGYEFDAGTTVLTDGNAFEEAAEVSESGVYFAVAEMPVSGRNWTRWLLFPKYEQVSIELWNADGESQTFDLQCPLEPTYFDNPAFPGSDWLPKVQLHGAENKANDGADVLVFFAGFASTPVYVSGSYEVSKSYFLTNDSAAMTELAGGPCWDLTRTGIALTALPSFRRTLSDQGIITDSWEWGVPAVRAVPGEVYGTGQAATLYDLWWKDYLADRYNADTRVLKCMADLRGLPVGQALLRRFVWLDGAVWTINAIRNHSLTSWDLTEVELVKVQDKSAYTYGPGSESHYLRVSPASNSYTIPGKGGTLTLTLRSSSDWTLVTADSPAWLTWNRVSGEGGTAVLEATLAANSSTTNRRTANVTITNEDGDTLTFSIVQEAKVAASISVSPASLTFTAAATGSSGASRGKSVKVTATGDWSVDTSTVPAWLTASASLTAVSFRVTANETGTQRTAQVKVYLDEDSTVYAIVNVTQEADSGGSISIVDTHGNEGRTSAASGDSFILNITATGAWTLTKTAAWVTLSATTGTGNGTVTVTVAQNTGSTDRSDAIVATLDGTSKTDSYYLQQEGVSIPAFELYRYGNMFYDYDEQPAGEPGYPCYGRIQVIASGPWTISTPDSWITPGGSWSGNGNGVIDYYCGVNTGAYRTGRIIGTCGTATATFYVRQEGAGGGVSAYFSLSSINAAAQDITLVINAPSGTPWSVTDISSALTLSYTSGSGPDEIPVHVAQNYGAAARTLHVNVNGTYVYLTQAAAGSSTYFRVSPFGIVTVDANTTSKTFTIESNTSWGVTSSHPDITISPASGSNNGSVTVSFPVNTGDSRITYPLEFQTTSGDTITVNVSIRQEPPSGPTPSGDVSVSPGTVELDGAGESKNVTVTTAYSWEANPSASWITVTPSSGSGISTVTISAGANPGATRTGEVVFSGHGNATLTVIQGPNAYLDVTSNDVTIPAEGGSEAVTVYASGVWRVTDGIIPSWLSVSMPSYSGSVQGEALTFIANSANTSSSARTVTLRFALYDYPDVYQDITITQEGSSTLYVSPNTARIGARDYDGYMNVVSNTDWEITDISEGITIDPDFYEGTGNAVIPYYVGGNPTLRARTMTVSFQSTDGHDKTATFTVYQEAGQLITSPYSYTFAGSGEQLPFKVISSALWEVYTKPAWISVTPSSGGANTPDGLDVVMEASQNTDTVNGRSGTVVFRHTENPSNTWDMLVSQTAGPVTTLTINPTSLTLSDEEQYTGTLEIRSSGSWTVVTEKRDPYHPSDATESADDIITFSAYSGSGNADLTFTLARNGGDEARTVWVRVRNGSGTIVRTLEIWQPADDGLLTVTPDVSELVFSSDTPTTTLYVRSTLGWSMTGPAWLSMSPSGGTPGASVAVTLTATVDPVRVGFGRLRITLSDGTTRDIAVRTVPDFTPIS